MSDIARSVGSNVNRLRRQRGLSLADLGRESGLAKGTLVAIEAGRGNPTVETLHVLTRALGATLGDLVSDPPPVGAQVVRRSQGPVLPGEDMDARMVSRLTAGALTVEIYELRMGASGHQHSPAHAAGVHEQIVVTSGSMRAGPEDDAVELARGDLASYPGDVPHAYEALEGDTEAILVMTFPAAVAPDHAVG